MVVSLLLQGPQRGNWGHCRATRSYAYRPPDPPSTGPGKEHNCSDQSTMLHALLHDRVMDLDEDWDAYEARFGVYRF